MFGRRHAVTKSSSRLSGRPARLILTFFVVFVLLTLVFYGGRGSRFVSGMVTHWADQQGIQVEVDGVRMVGWGRVALNGVSLPDAPFGLEAIDAERVIVSFDLFSFLRGARGAALVRDITLVRPVLTVDVPDTPMEKASDTAALSADTPRVTAESYESVGNSWLFGDNALHIEIRQGQYAVQASGNEVHGTVDFRGQADATGIQLDSLIMTAEGPHFSGEIRTGGKMSWPNAERAIAGTLHGDDLKITMAGDAYVLDSFDASFRLNETGLHVDAFTGTNDAALLTLTGTVKNNGELDVAVDGKQLDLADDIPLLGRIGFSGPGHFEGHLTGHLTRPVLEGHAEVGPGDVWGRPNVSGTGQLTITRDALQFADVRLRQYGGEYHLDGMFVYTSENGPGHLDMNVQSASGRVQELLAVLGWDVPVTGRLDGNLQFQGDLGAVKAAGTVDVVEAVALGQPFDHVAGSFVWNDGIVHIDDANVALGTGHLALDGSIDVTSDRGNVRFAADDWPLGFTRLFDDRFGQILGGLINVHDGRVTGSLSSPQITGTLEAEALRVGPTLFRSVGGRLAYTNSALELIDLSGTRAGGGDYALSGIIELSDVDAPFSDVEITVANERLRSLLQLANEELPAVLIDGQVAGSIRLKGTLSDPTAEMDLILKEAFSLRQGIRIAMRFADGALRVSDLGLISEG